MHTFKMAERRIECRQAWREELVYPLRIFFSVVGRNLFLFMYRCSFDLEYIRFKPYVFNINRRKQTTKV